MEYNLNFLSLGIWDIVKIGYTSLFGGLSTLDEIKVHENNVKARNEIVISLSNSSS